MRNNTNRRARSRAELEETYDRLAAENRARLVKTTKGNAKALAKYDQMSAAHRDRTINAVRRPNATEKIAQWERKKNQRAVRTGGQW